MICISDCLTFLKFENWRELAWALEETSKCWKTLQEGRLLLFHFGFFFLHFKRDIPV